MEQEPQSHILNQLIADLGFTETPKLVELKDQIIHQLSSVREVYPLPAPLIYLRTEYQLQAEELINSKEDPLDFAKAQIGLIITKARMFQQAGWKDRFKAEIEDAITYAGNMGFNEVVQTLRSLTQR